MQRCITLELSRCMSAREDVMQATRQISSRRMYGWLLVGFIGCIGYILIRRTKRFWMNLLFPVG